jgi:hypothetical protein
MMLGLLAIILMIESAGCYGLALSAVTPAAVHFSLVRGFNLFPQDSLRRTSSRHYFLVIVCSVLIVAVVVICG